MPNDTGANLQAVPLSALFFCDQDAFDELMGRLADNRGGIDFFRSVAKCARDTEEEPEEAEIHPACVDCVPIRPTVWLKMRRLNTNKNGVVTSRGPWTHTLQLGRGKVDDQGTLTDCVTGKGPNGEDLKTLPAGLYEVFGDAVEAVVGADGKPLSSDPELSDFLKAVLPERDLANDKIVDPPAVAPIVQVSIEHQLCNPEFIADGAFHDDNLNNREISNLSLKLPTPGADLLAADVHYWEGGDPSKDERVNFQSGGRFGLAPVSLDLGINFQMWKVQCYFERAKRVFEARAGVRSSLMATLKMLDASIGFWQALDRMYAQAGPSLLGAAICPLLEALKQREKAGGVTPYRPVLDKLLRVRNKLVRLAPGYAACLPRYDGFREFSDADLLDRYIQPLFALLTSKKFLETLSRAIALRSLPDGYARLLRDAVEGLAIEKANGIAATIRKLRRDFRGVSADLEVAPLPGGGPSLPPPCKFPGFAPGSALFGTPSALLAALAIYWGSLEMDIPKLVAAEGGAGEGEGGEKKEGEGGEKGEEKKEGFATGAKEAFEMTAKSLEWTGKLLHGNVSALRTALKNATGKSDIKRLKGLVKEARGYHEIAEKAELAFNVVEVVMNFSSMLDDLQGLGQTGVDLKSLKFWSYSLKLTKHTINTIKKVEELGAGLKLWKLSKNSAMKGTLDGLGKVAKGIDAIFEFAEGAECFAEADKDYPEDIKKFQGAKAEDIQAALHVADGVAHMLVGLGDVSGMLPPPFDVAALPLQAVGHAMLWIDWAWNQALNHAKTEREFFQYTLWGETVLRLFRRSHAFGPPFVMVSDRNASPAQAIACEHTLKAPDGFEKQSEIDEKADTDSLALEIPEGANLDDGKRRWWTTTFAKLDEATSRFSATPNDPPLLDLLFDLGYRWGGYGTPINKNGNDFVPGTTTLREHAVTDGPCVDDSTFGNLFDHLDLEDWWAIAALAGGNPAVFKKIQGIAAEDTSSADKIDEIAGWWKDSVLGFGNDAKVARSPEDQDPAPLEPEEMNTWLKDKHMESLALRLKGDEAGNGAGLGHPIPTTLPWQDDARIHHAWLIQLQSLPLLDALMVVPYAGFLKDRLPEKGVLNLLEQLSPVLSGLHDLTDYNDYLFFPGLIVAAPLDFGDAAALKEFNEAARRRGALNLKEVMAFFWQNNFIPGLAENSLPSWNWRDDAAVKAVKVLRILLGDDYVTKVLDAVTASNDPSKVLQALDRAWIFVTGPLAQTCGYAAPYEKVRYGLMGGIVGHYKQVEDAWRETYGERNFPPTFAAKVHCGNLGAAFARKMAVVNFQVTELDAVYGYCSTTGDQALGLSLAIGADEAPGKYEKFWLKGADDKNRESDSLYVFRWAIRDTRDKANPGPVITITHIRSASGDFSRWRKGCRDSFDDRTKPYFEATYETGDWSDQAAYAQAFGLPFPTIADGCFFKDDLDGYAVGPVYAFKGHRSMFWPYPDKYEFTVTDSPGKWKAVRRDGNWLLDSQDASSDEGEIRLVVKESADGRAFVHRYEVASITCTVGAPKADSFILVGDKVDVAVQLDPTPVGPPPVGHLFFAGSFVADPKKIDYSADDGTAAQSMPSGTGKVVVPESPERDPSDDAGVRLRILQNIALKPGPTIAETRLFLYERWLAQCSVKLPATVTNSHFRRRSTAADRVDKVENIDDATTIELPWIYGWGFFSELTIKRQVQHGGAALDPQDLAGLEAIVGAKPGGATREEWRIAVDDPAGGWQKIPITQGSQTVSLGGSAATWQVDVGSGGLHLHPADGKRDQSNSVPKQLLIEYHLFVDGRDRDDIRHLVKRVTITFVKKVAAKYATYATDNYKSETMYNPMQSIDAVPDDHVKGYCLCFKDEDNAEVPLKAQWRLDPPELGSVSNAPSSDPASVQFNGTARQGFLIGRVPEEDNPVDVKIAVDLRSVLRLEAVQKAKVVWQENGSPPAGEGYLEDPNDGRYFKWDYPDVNTVDLWAATQSLLWRPETPKYQRPAPREWKGIDCRIHIVQKDTRKGPPTFSSSTLGMTVSPANDPHYVFLRSEQANQDPTIGPSKTIDFSVNGEPITVAVVAQDYT